MILFFYKKNKRIFEANSLVLMDKRQLENLMSKHEDGDIGKNNLPEPVIKLKKGFFSTFYNNNSQSSIFWSPPLSTFFPIFFFSKSFSRDNRLPESSQPFYLISEF